jgi:hypothetical protein
MGELTLAEVLQHPLERTTAGLPARPVCRSCNHGRSIHDSWGCQPPCRCGVSIVDIGVTAVAK